ncbi:uncharacterized protein TNCV_4267661 [Trichonephila clavipes]|nr:uncharacterized protein TNCV_4267661 [Trichonephila clavipes]
MPRKYCIYTDSLSVLEALENYNDRCHPVVCTILDITCRLYSKGLDIMFCWLPSHVGILGNEQADSAAKSATTHLPLAVPLSDMKRVIMHHIFKIWQESWSQQLGNKLHSVKPVIGAWPVMPMRRTDVKLTRLRIGHTRFTHRHLLFGERAPECPSCNVSYTVHHILIDCPVFNHHRITFFHKSVLTFSDLVGESPHTKIKSTVAPVVFQRVFAYHRSQYSSYSTIYTDGSKRADYVGCGVVIEDVMHGYWLDTSCSIFVAEAVAIYRTLQLIDSNMPRKYCIYTDSISILEALENYDDRCHPVVCKILDITSGLYSKGLDIVFCWLPSHVGIIGNEQADSAAKSATTHLPLAVPLSDMKRVIMHHIFKIWQESWSQQLDNKLLSVKPVIGAWSVMPMRRNDVKLTRLRIGHTRLTHRHLLFGERAPEYSPITISPHKTLDFCTGVISESDLLTTPDAEILDGFSDQGVIQIRRITIKKDNSVIPTKHLILTFNRPKLPTTIKADYLNWHSSTDCTLEPKCINCSQIHTADSKLCPKWKTEKEIQTIKTNRNISYFGARKLIAPQFSQTYGQVAKPSIATSTTQTDENITKIKCPPLQILKPLLSVPHPNASPSITSNSTSSSTTQANLLPSASSIKPTTKIASRLPKPISSAAAPDNNLNTSASSLSAETRTLIRSNKSAALSTEIQPLPESDPTASNGEHFNAPEVPQCAKRNSRNRRKRPKVQKAEIKIQMAPHRPRKSTPTESTTDEDDMIMYDVQVEELEPNPEDKFAVMECFVNNPSEYMRALTPSRFRNTWPKLAFAPLNPTFTSLHSTSSSTIQANLLPSAFSIKPTIKIASRLPKPISSAAAPDNSLNTSASSLSAETRTLIRSNKSASLMGLTSFR